MWWDGHGICQLRRFYSGRSRYALICDSSPGVASNRMMRSEISTPADPSRTMRLRLHVVLLVVVAVCWLVPCALADDTLTVNALEEAHPATTIPPQLLDEKSLRVATTDDLDAELVATKEASTHTKEQPASETTANTTAGLAPSLVLAAGGAAIGIVLLAFHKRRARHNDKDGEDPLRQAFLFHDMDYAAM